MISTRSFDNDGNNSQSLQMILMLLEKTEQIISIINLSDGMIKKYNQLKEITFAKCKLPFVPLVKRHSQQTSQTNSHNSTMNEFSTRIDNNTNSTQNNSTTFENIKNLTIKKNLMIELLLEIIEKQKMSDIKLYRGQMSTDIENLTKMLDNIYNTNLNSTSLYKYDNEFDYKIDEMRFKDYLSKCDMNIKSLTIKSSSSSLSFDDNSFDNIITGYNKKIDDLKKMHQLELSTYEKKFNELKQNYNPELANEYKKQIEIYSEISNMIIPVFNKYSKKKLSGDFDDNAFSEPILNQINFLLCFLEQLFTDNKHVIETIKQIEEDKEILEKEISLPFVINSIKRNDTLQKLFEMCYQKENNTNADSNSKEINELIEKISNILN